MTEHIFNTQLQIAFHQQKKNRSKTSPMFEGVTDLLYLSNANLTALSLCSLKVIIDCGNYLQFHVELRTQINLKMNL